MTEPVIQIRGLSVAYGSHQAVRDVSVDIPARQITAIIGPSGCGKTTLLRSISRLVELVAGVRVWGLRRYFASGITDLVVEHAGRPVLVVRHRHGLRA